MGFTNVGGDPLKWSATIDHPSIVSLTGPTQGSLAAGASATLSLTAQPVPTSSVAGSELLAVLTITTNDPTNPSISIPIHFIARGATLQLAPSTLDFGEVPLGIAAPPLGLTLSNTGNADVTLSYAAPTNSAFSESTPTAAATLAAGASVHPTFVFQPTTAGLSSATVALQVVGPVCGGPLPAIALAGDGATGAAGVSPGTIDFGSVNCGTSASSQTVTVLNASDAPFQFTAALAMGAQSPYAVSPASGTVPPRSSATLTVTPASIPTTPSFASDAYDDTLTVSTDITGDSAHTVMLTESAAGAALALTGAAFGDTMVGATGNATLTVTNAGSSPANVTLATTSPFAVPASPITVPAFGMVSVAATYTPDPYQLGLPATGSVTMTTSDVTCGPSQPATLTGRSIDRATTIFAGNYATCASAVSGLAYCWGDNTYYNLGDMTVGIRATPAPLPGITDVTSFDGYGTATCALRQGGDLWCWGENVEGYNRQTLYPSQFPFPAPVVAFSYGGANQMYLQSTGELDAIGAYDGDGTAMAYDLEPLSNETNVTSLSVGASSCVVQGGAVSCWGNNTFDDVGVTTSGPVPSPQAISNIGDTAVVVCGSDTSCALRTDGSAICWGRTIDGALGDGTVGHTGAPTNSVVGLTDAVSLAVGLDVACALTSSGGVECWGANADGILGDVTAPDSYSPKVIPSISNAVALSVRWLTACVVLSDGRAQCWGSNQSGNIGIGTHSAAVATPTFVVGFD